MKTAVMYGAGNIGRGFLGQLFYQSGYHTVFVDVNPDFIIELNKAGKYPLRLVSNLQTTEIEISNISALSCTDVEKVATAIADCDILCTAVGVNALPSIVKNIAEGIKKRYAFDKELNIIICENKIDADIYLKGMIKQELDAEYHSFFEEKVGFIESSVGRMVPVMTEDMKESNPLRVWAEPYCILPVNKAAFKGDLPEIHGMQAEEDFDYYIKSKLYLHNMGHCLTAYLGQLNGHIYIYEAIANDGIRDIVKTAMYNQAEALSLEYNKSYSHVKAYAKELIERFGNHHLKDTVWRVGRDLARKLGENDRLLGAIALCEKHGIDSTYIKIGVAAALLFGEKYEASRIKIGGWANNE